MAHLVRAIRLRRLRRLLAELERAAAEGRRVPA